MIVTKDMVETHPVSAEKIWDSLSDFSSYSFNKSHAVSYSIVAYMTARIWTYHRDELLQYEMNFGGRKRLDKAVKIATDLGMEVVFPTYQKMDLDHWMVQNGKVLVPGYATQNYQSLSDFLFGQEPSKLTLILNGVCDGACRDRQGLVNLLKALGTSAQQPGFPDCNTMQELLRQGELADLWKVEQQGSQWRVLVKKRRGEKEVLIHQGVHADVLEHAIKQDFKTFGTVRSGLLAQYPLPQPLEILGERFPSIVEQERRKMLERFPEMDPEVLQKKLQWNLRDRLKKWIWKQEPKLKRYQDQWYRAILVDQKKFDKYMKVTLLFEDGEHLFYVRDQELMQALLKHNKRDVLDLRLQLDPYISKNLELVKQWKLLGLQEQEAPVQIGVTEEL